jgi:arylformamidase
MRRGEKYWRKNSGLSTDLARALRQYCSLLRAVGVDFVSVFSYHNGDIDEIAHHKFLLDEGLLLIEDMNLSEMSNPIAKVLCFPLPVDSADGTPITAITEIVD